MLETLDHTLRIGSTPTFLYFDLYLYSAYAAHYVYLILIQVDVAVDTRMRHFTRNLEVKIAISCAY